MRAHGYVMAKTDATREADRLALLESSADPATIGCLQRLGVRSGWRCLEVGAGHGSIARWLAEKVGPEGAVLAADIDPRFLTDMPANVQVRALDIREEGLEAQAYDLVHCRMLLMHLADPSAALARLADALRPGGLLLAEEGDFGLYHYGGHPDGEALSQGAHQSFVAMGRAGIMDAYFGPPAGDVRCLWHRAARHGGADASRRTRRPHVRVRARDRARLAAATDRGRCHGGWRGWAAGGLLHRAEEHRHRSEQRSRVGSQATMSGTSHRIVKRCRQGASRSSRSASSPQQML